MGIFESTSQKLCRYARDGNVTKVSALLDKGAMIETKDKSGWTPLHESCSRGQLEVVRQLLARGASIDSRTNYGFTPLHQACYYGSLEVARLLLDRGANKDSRTNPGGTPLHKACYRGHAEIARLLLDRGANIEAKGGEDETSLHKACERGHLEVVELLVARGANINVKCSGGETPAELTSDDEVGKKIRKAISTQPPPVSFYTTLVNSSEIKKGPKLFLEKLASLISDVHEMKMFYTIARFCQRQHTIDDTLCQQCVAAALEKTAETCDNEHAIAIFKIILNKTKEDGLLTDYDLHRYDNRAEVKRMSESTFIRDMKEAIEANTSRIDMLEQRMDATDTMIHQFRRQILHRQRLESSVWVASLVVNAFTLGIGGTMMQVVSGPMVSAFDQFTKSVVDYGDLNHMEQQIQVMVTHPDGSTQNVNGYVVGSAETELKRQFELGSTLGMHLAADVFARKREHKVVREMTALIALGRTAAMCSPSAMESASQKPGLAQISSSERSSCNQSDTDHTESTRSIPPSDLIFPDASLSEEDEEQYPLHSAIKYGYADDIREALQESEEEDRNVEDSKGRTAIDLAALTGQLEVVKLLKEEGHRHSFKAKFAMQNICRKRSSHLDEYLGQVR